MWGLDLFCSVTIQYFNKKSLFNKKQIMRFRKKKKFNVDGMWFREGNEFQD